MKTEPKIFAIIVTYKGMRWYDKCFSSLRESTMPVQTVVVDNTPCDEDAEYIKAHFPEVHLIKTNENLGFGKANNLGMRYALDNGCDYVFLLNQDTWLIQNESIAELVAIAEAHPEYGIVSPMHLTATQDKLFMMIGLGQDNMPLISDLYLQNIDTIYETNYVNAAAWLLPRKILLEVGGFTPIFQQYAEDDDYINRVLYHHYKIGVCPSIKIVHDHQDSFSALVHKKSQGSHTLFAEWLNLKTSFSAGKYYRLYFRRWLKSVLSRDHNSRVYYAKAISILNRHKKQIRDMRIQNMQKQPSWL